MTTGQTGSSTEPPNDDSFYMEWAEQALAHLKQLREERPPTSRTGKKIRRILERLGQ